MLCVDPLMKHGALLCGFLVDPVDVHQQLLSAAGQVTSESFVELRTYLRKLLELAIDAFGQQCAGLRDFGVQVSDGGGEVGVVDLNLLAQFPVRSQPPNCFSLRPFCTRDARRATMTFRTLNRSHMSAKVFGQTLTANCFFPFDCK